LQQATNSSAGVFCQARVQLFDVAVFINLYDLSLANVTIIGTYPKANNVSGPPLNGVPYNGYGLLFPQHVPC
jgi:hypothetical protein